jgi:hypothetical protein
MRMLGVLLIAFATGVAEPALAQAITPGTRPLGGIFGASRRSPTDPSPAAVVYLDLGGGYDQNLDDPEGFAPPIQVFNPQQSGYLGNVTTSVQYRRGTVARFLESRGTGYVSHASEGAGRVISGAANLEGATNFGRRNGVLGTVSGAYEPTFLFNAFGPIAGDVEGGVVPGSTPTRGINQQEWFAFQGSANLFRDWTPRQRTAVQYSGQRRRPASGPGFTSFANTAAVRHNWNMREHAVLQLSYSFNGNTQTDQLGDAQPFKSQVAEIALNLTRPLSPDRRLALTVGGGVNKASTSRPFRQIDFVVPVVTASARLDLTRDMTVSLDARRDVTILDGLSPEPFLTNTGSLRVLMRSSDRVQVSGSASFSRGASEVSSTGSFQNVLGTVQMHYALARCCAVFANYSYYQYEIFDVTTVQPGLPSRYELNSVRVGLSFWLPVYGRS